MFIGEPMLTQNELIAKLKEDRETNFFLEAIGEDGYDFIYKLYEAAYIQGYENGDHDGFWQARGRRY